MPSASLVKPTHKAIVAYYQTLQAYGEHDVEHESALRSAFQNLLAESAKAHHWMLVPEQRTKVGGKTTIPDATLCDEYNLHRGYWEAKDTDDKLDAEISKKVAKGYPLPDFAVQAPLLSLPGILKTDLATIPAPVPYLQPDADRRARWQQELRTVRAYNVGIAWQGSKLHRGDRFRSVPLEQFAPLAEVDGVRLVSLQRGPGSEQINKINDSWTVLDPVGWPGDPAASWLEMAALMSALDLVVTVDTAVAHLAAALAVPVWVALPFVPDWRWLLEREDSPWYPSMRLFRQQRQDDWPEVFARIADALRQRLATTRPRGEDS